jgi:hypothetical protein
MLSNGEFVVNADAAARHASLLESINANRLADGGWAGDTRAMDYLLAAGGHVRHFIRRSTTGDLS